MQANNDELGEIIPRNDKYYGKIMRRQFSTGGDFLFVFVTQNDRMHLAFQGTVSRCVLTPWPNRGNSYCGTSARKFDLIAKLKVQ